MTEETKGQESDVTETETVKGTGPENTAQESAAGVGRRRFLSLGAAGLAGASAAGLVTRDANALMQSVSRTLSLGVTPGADTIAEMPKYSEAWNSISAKPFGGFRFALGYIGEGVDMMDPKQDVPNPSGLFESVMPDIVSAVGGNETAARSAEYWYRDILGWENDTLANDFWSFINWARRVYGLDFDDPSVDGMETALGTFAYPGSPNPRDETSLWSPRIASDGKGGYARMAPTLLAPSVGYTVVFRAGHSHPNYTGGTTAGSPDDAGKVRDGGVWGGTVQSLDVLRIMQEVAAGERTYTTPNGPSSNPAQWGQWWRRVAALDGVDIEAIDADAPMSERAAPRPNWPVGYLSRGTDFFWGNYDLKFGRDEPTVTLHYESQVPTRFRDFDGIPEAFICELNAHPGGTDMPQEQIDMGLQDVDGSISGFADLNDPSLNDQNPFGHGRVHGTSYPRGVDAQGRTTFHLRNWLLFPPRLNAVNSINDSVPGKGVLS